MPSEPSEQAPGLARQLASDRVVRATGEVLVGIALPYLIPIVEPSRLAELSEGPFFVPLSALVVIATLLGVRRLENVAERRFWTFFGASFSCWLASLILTELPGWTNSDPVSVFAYEALILGLYTTAILATTQAPHLPRTERPDTLDRNIVLAGTLGFGLAMWSGYVVLDLQDTGSGMSEDVRGLAFEPFFTTKGVGEGNGLGLSTVEGIVEQSGGFVTIDSTPGRGTRVRLHFPWTAERPDALPQGSP